MKKKFQGDKLLIIILIIAIVIAVWRITYGITKLNKVTMQQSTVQLQVSNPYSFSVDMEIKCDWDGRKYKMYKRTIFPARSISFLKVPSNLKQCELWPHVNLLK